MRIFHTKGGRALADEKKSLGLYLHVTFCVQKCRYCDFYSGASSEEEREAYVNALIAHLKHESAFAQDFSVDTVYFGGGTPSLLTPAQFSAILDTVRGHFDLAPDAEITAECNPVTAVDGLLSGMRTAGVNRLSIGLQSANDAELALLGRPHDLAAFLSTFAAARDAGFDNVSVDLMFGIPDQTLSSLEKSLLTVCDLFPEHLSVYGLRIEEGTPFWRMRDTLALPDEEGEAEMAERIASVLTDRGFEHYEVSNFAKPGRRSRHNMRYWLGADYLGFGPAAHSYFEGVRFDTAPDRARYIAAVSKGDFAALRQNRSPIAGKEAMDEYVMLRMRLFEGIDEADFSTRFGTSLEDAYCISPALFGGGFLTKTPRGIAFSEKGMRVSNAILSDWLDFGH